MEKKIGTGKELFVQARKQSNQPVMVCAHGTNWDENYCFVIERIDFWGRPIGSEFIDGKRIRQRSFRKTTLLQLHSCRWSKQVFEYYGYVEPIKEKTKRSINEPVNNLVSSSKDNIEKEAVAEPKSCRNCRNYKNNTCNGMRKAETCTDYIFMPTVSQEIKAMWPTEMLASYYRRKDAERHHEH